MLSQLGLQHNEAFYTEARKVYEAAGRSIIDATVDGKCNIFKKGDYKDLMYRKPAAAGASNACDLPEIPRKPELLWCRHTRWPAAGQRHGSLRHYGLQIIALQLKEKLDHI